MNSQASYWNNVFSNSNLQKNHYDSWLDKYCILLFKHKEGLIVDLGCGVGDDTVFLAEKGYKVIACDFSEEAIKIVHSKVPAVPTFRFDMLEGLPFSDASVDCIISDLSLHYFSDKETKKIVNEMKRVLIPDGIILCRVNSTLDVNYGAMTGEKIEENYFLVNGCTKRFFNEEYLSLIFNGFYIFYINEYATLKYDKPKVVWEIALSKSHIDFAVT